MSSVPNMKFLAEIKREYPLIGLALTIHRSVRDTPITFKDKPYLIELYKDFPVIKSADIIKAVQTGISELMIQLILERSGWAHKICAYVLPTYSLRNRFVQKRIDPLLDRVPEYKSRAHGSGNVAGKRFGRGSLLFLGSNTPSDFVEFSADIMVIDEFDRCVPENIRMARDRLRASPNPQLFRLGNPTIPKFGVDGLYEKTDQRRWYTKCPRCNGWQPLDWLINYVHRDKSGRYIPRDKEAFEIKKPDNFDLRPVCRFCHKPFNQWEAKKSQWVAENRDSVKRGYRISRLNVLNQNIWELYGEWVEAQSSSMLLMTFYNSVLGMAYIPEGSYITDDMINKACIGDPMDEVGGEKYKNEMVSMGVDVGSLLNFVISINKTNAAGERIRECVAAGTVMTFDQLERVIRNYHANVVVVDVRPETRKVKELRAKFIGSIETVVYMCQFHRSAKVGAVSYGIKVDGRSGLITVDRTQVLDATLDELNNGLRIFPEDVCSVKDFAKQLKAPKRVLKDGDDNFIWTKGPADHYRFADAYDRIAADQLSGGGSYEELDLSDD